MPSPDRSSRRAIEISENSHCSRPSALSSTTSTCAASRPLTPWAPANTTSCMVCPRTASGLCSPTAHSTASVMFDLPLPLGPTITLIPGPKSSRTRSGNDLNPLRVIDFRCMVASRGSGLLVELEQGLLCGLLFGLLLAAPAAGPERAAGNLGDGLEGAVVRRPVLAPDAVEDDLAALRQPLLQLALEVRVVIQCPLHLRRERLRHRFRGPLEAELDEAGADPRLDALGQDAVRVEEAAGLVLVALRRGFPHRLGDA